MKYITDFYKEVQKGIRGAHYAVKFFFTNNAVTHRKIGSFLKRSSIMKELVQYTEKQNGFVDIISPVQVKQIEHYFKSDNYKLNVQQISNPEFIQPLEKLLKAFLIIDYNHVYLRPTEMLEGGFFMNEKKELFDMFYIFSQMIQRENKIWRQNLFSNNHKEINEERIQLASLPQYLEEARLKILSKSLKRER